MERMRCLFSSFAASFRQRVNCYYLAVVLIGVGVFLMGGCHCYRVAIERQERAFAAEQARQVSLAKQAIEFHFSDLTAFLSSHLNCPGLSGGAEESCRFLIAELLDNSSRIHPELTALAYANSPDGFLLSRSLRDGGEEDFKFLRQALSSCWSRLEASTEYFCVPRLSIDSSRQLMAVMLPRYSGGALAGVLGASVDLREFLFRYVSIMRSGGLGSAFVLDQQGRVLYDHEEEIIGRSVFDGLHRDYAEALRMDERMMAELSGHGSYAFPFERNGRMVRKLVSWDSVLLGDVRLVLALSSPDRDVWKLLSAFHRSMILFGLAMALFIVVVSMIFFFYRRSAERSLFASEARYGAIVESQAELVCRVCPDGKLSFVNDAFCRYYGRAREDLLGCDLSELLDPEEVDGMVSLFGRLTPKFPLDERSGRFVSSGGEERWQQWSTVGIFDMDGRLAEIQRVGHDITQRKMAEESLRESERFRSILLKNSPYAIGVLKPDATVAYVNPAMERLTGISAEDLVGSRLPLPWWDGEMVDSLFAHFSAAERRGLHQITACMKDRNGGTVWIEVATSPVRDGDRVKYLISTVADVSGLKKLNDRMLEEKERKYRSFFQHIGDSVFQCRLEGNSFSCIFFANEPLHRWLSFPSGQIVGMFPSELLPTLDEKKLIERIHAMSEGCHFQFERNALHWGGKLSPAEVRVTSFLSDGHRLVLFSMRDISARKEAERQQRFYQTRLQNMASQLSIVKEKERRQIAIKLHDSIGQQLAVSKIQLGMIYNKLDNSEIGERLDEVLDILDSCIAFVRTMTFDLAPPVLYELGIGASLEWLAEKMYREHGLLVSCEIEEGLPPMDDDLKAFAFRAIRELLFNVIKHAETDEAKVVLSTSDRNVIHGEVVDGGRGFDPGEVPSYGGNEGYFGLFSIRERLRYMGGTLVLDSRKGGGTRIIFEFPIDSTKNSGEV